MEEIEVPLEKVSEDMHHHAEHATENWIMRVAMSSAFLAVFAAIAALLAGHHSNEAMIEQLQASDHWSYYQAKGIKAAILSTHLDTLVALGKKPSDEQTAKLAEYKKEQEDISEKGREKEASSKHHLVAHQVYARAVTFFQVAIAIGAVAVLSHRKKFWYVSLVFGFVGLGFLVQGFLL